MAGSVELNSVPPVTLPPCIILSLTGFQIFDPAGASKALPYFHADASNGPWFTAPGGATLRALLSLPAGSRKRKLRRSRGRVIGVRIGVRRWLLCPVLRQKTKRGYTESRPRDCQKKHSLYRTPTRLNSSHVR